MLLPSLPKSLILFSSFLSGNKLILSLRWLQAWSQPFLVAGHALVPACGRTSAVTWCKWDRLLGNALGIRCSKQWSTALSASGCCILLPFWDQYFGFAMSDIHVMCFVHERESKLGKVLVVQSHGRDKHGTSESNTLCQDGVPTTFWLVD